MPLLTRPGSPQADPAGLPGLLDKLIAQPEIVMLLGPIEIDRAGTDGLQRALHSERADIHAIA